MRVKKFAVDSSQNIDPHYHSLIKAYIIVLMQSIASRARRLDPLKAIPKAFLDQRRSSENKEKKYE
jgi:hypothetical protein